MSFRMNDLSDAYEATLSTDRDCPSWLPVEGSGIGFALAALTLTAATALLAGWAPIPFSAITLALFAGPHNWLEFRYILARMPGRWGRLRAFFLLAGIGVGGLTTAFAALLWLSAQTEADAWWPPFAFSAWNVVLLLWVALLARLRSQQNPRRDWDLIGPISSILLVPACLVPAACSLVLVYLHPMLAFWMLDRELLRSRPGWRPAYHGCLASIPIFLGLLWWGLAGQPN
jgi:hypothetical protein